MEIIFVLIVLVIILILFLRSCGNSLNTNEDPIAFKDSVFGKRIKKQFEKEKVYPLDLKGYSGILIAGDRLISFSDNGKNIEQ